MTSRLRVWTKWILLIATWAIAIVTLTKFSRAMWERYHSEERIEIRGKRELTIIDREHKVRYEFAKQYCAGKTVADIASGTGYGMGILRTVAKSVEGYDREPLGQKFIIDLEKQAWSEHYDVIVSFETIEHLANPEFFLGNVQKTAKMLLLSTPLDERKGWATNPYHKQVWTDASIKKLLEEFFRCEYYYQYGTRIEKDLPKNMRRLFVAVCTSPINSADVQP
ncbi:MAG TPA: methyltransferase domain-containing protein [Bryobacteraceae bacterium]|nr:methyltransferase domain-containing protein [Bryobacteraceae bacterium]